ncbi:ATP-binding protein [Spirosoma sp. HMF3257]|uniref:ATP-binding protein n=1 Tax=Spirosoma telluris TaxID=2183553 RepID=A0A327NK21_9BACT|nr:ATP-binding protein [Spirosoma telluris]RAI72898.1 ATP-binding protein [Spirosoma telluris]
MEQDINEETIRKELAQILNEDANNYSRILQLSMMLSRYDSDNIRFSVDAGVVDRLGTELVARQETAVSELVKNSYDADAKKVTLTFEDSDAIGGTLTVIDDGLGMTRDQLINGFMRISSTEKLHNPLSERYQRNRSGQKGIGRFAVQRLGERLTIVTQTLSSSNALRLTIEWDQYKGDLDLAVIGNRIETIKKNQKEGTILTIEKLRDRWSQASIKRIYRYVTAIIQPFPLSKESKEVVENNVTLTDPGFKTSFIKVEDARRIVIADEASMVYDHALTIIEGWIDDSGIGVYTITSKKLGIDEIGQIGSDPEDNARPFSLLRHVRFRAYYYVYNADLIPKMQESSIKNLSRKQGGIRLYRNGFRVLPYGETGNDWLKLDASIRRRSILPVHGNTNFFGFVELTDKNKMFNETSSREGLMDNEAFVQLQNFVYRTLLTGVIRTAEARNVKIASGQRKEGKLYEKIEISIKNIAHTIEALDKELEEEEGNIEIKKKRKSRLKKLKQEIEKVAILQKEEQKAYIKERSMLRVLSSVGLTIGQFIHEVRDYIYNMESDIKFLLEKLQADHVSLERLLILDKNVTTFQTYTSYFDGVVSQNVVRNLAPIELQNTVERFWDSIVNDAQKSGINFQKPKELPFTCLHFLCIHRSGLLFCLIFIQIQRKPSNELKSKEKFVLSVVFLVVMCILNFQILEMESLKKTKKVFLKSFSPRLRQAFWMI